METRSHYYPLLQKLLELPAFTATQAVQAGIPRHALAYFQKIGMLEHVGRGVYRDSSYESDSDPLLEGLAIASSNVPDCAICLISALSYYELTDEIPREYWLAIPHKRRAPNRRGVRAVRMRNMETGLSSICVEGQTMAIFDRERCIIDAFRYLSPEIAIKALQRYLNDKERKPNLNKLKDYAQQLRVNIKPYLLSLMI